jgi:hypothetical protein
MAPVTERTLPVNGIDLHLSEAGHRVHAPTGSTRCCWSCWAPEARPQRPQPSYGWWVPGSRNQ